jgi:MFS family permease
VSAGLVPLGLVTLAFNLGGGLVAPALPLYARSLGADYRDLGLIGASHGLAFAALTIPLGQASDRVGRRAILLASALAVGAAACTYLLATGVAGLIAGKLLEAAGWAAFWPALEAWVAERFGRRAGTAMGVGYGAYAAAFVLGTSGAGFLIEWAGLRTPFAGYVVTSTAAALLVLALVPRGTAPLPEAADASGGPERVVRDTRAAGAQRRLAHATGFVYVFGLGTVLSFLPAYATDRGLGPRGVGLLFASYWVARLAASLGSGRASDRLGRRRVLLPALGGSSVAALLVAAPLGPVALAAGTIGLGASAGACAPACVGLIADHVRPADRGIAMGLFEASCGLSMLLAGLVGGYAADALGGEAPYVLVAGLGALWGVYLARRLPATA